MIQRSATPAVAIAACLYQAAASEEIRLLPAGEFAASDGRPGPGRSWKLTDADGRALAAKMNARVTPMVIDYEHQTLHAEANGRPAPAAAWARRFEWRDGVGLFAVDVAWTDRARKAIEAGEYRFISPVFVCDRATGVVSDLLHAALTNFPALDGLNDFADRMFRLFREQGHDHPALDGMAEVADRIAARLAGSPTGDRTMNPLLQKLLAAIGLQADATEDAALTAVAALKVRADELDQQLGAARTEVAALKAKTAGPDEQTLAAMRTLQTEVATLTGRLATRDLDDVIAAALAAGKLVPAQEKWARDLGARDLQALKSYIESAPAVAALSGHQSRGRAPAAGDDARAIAAKAQDYIAEQAKSGRVVGAVEAVRHVHQAA